LLLVGSDGGGVEAVGGGAGVAVGAGARSAPVIWHPFRATDVRRERASVGLWLCLMLVYCLLDCDRS